MAKHVLMITEFRNSDFRRVTYEVASEGRRIADALGARLVAVALGPGFGTRPRSLESTGWTRFLCSTILPGTLFGGNLRSGYRGGRAEHSAGSGFAARFG